MFMSILGGIGGPEGGEVALGLYARSIMGRVCRGGVSTEGEI